MVKASALLDDGTLLVVLGLSDANERMLRRDRPVLFNLADVGGPDLQLCLTYRHADGRAGFPRDFGGASVVLGDAALAAMRRTPVEFACDGLRFVIFRGKDEATMAAQMRGLVTPATRVMHEGYGPADVPPGGN